MTPRYPASAVLVERSVLLKQRGLQASVQWAPRTANREANRLANGLTQDFNPACECVIDLATVHWLILPRALEEGRQAEQAYQAFRASGQDPQRGAKTATQETRGTPTQDESLVSSLEKDVKSVICCYDSPLIMVSCLSL